MSDYRLPSTGDGVLNITNIPSSHVTKQYHLVVVTFRVSRRRREMYCGHARLCVCLSAAACLHYCTDPDVTWGSGRGCPLVVHYWVDLQSVHGLHCYGNTRNVWQSPAVISQAHRTHYACRRRLLASDKIDAPVACATLSATRPFHVVHTMGVVTRTRHVSEYMLVLALCLVMSAVRVRLSVFNWL